MRIWQNGGTLIQASWADMQQSNCKPIIFMYYMLKVTSAATRLGKPQHTDAKPPGLATRLHPETQPADLPASHFVKARTDRSVLVGCWFAVTSHPNHSPSISGTTLPVTARVHIRGESYTRDQLGNTPWPAWFEYIPSPSALDLRSRTLIAHLSRLVLQHKLESPASEAK